MKMENVRHCPFCNSHEIYSSVLVTDKVQGILACNDCGVGWNLTYNFSNPIFYNIDVQDKDHPITNYKETMRNHLVNMWNTRYE
jgi:transcription elongation factor Elf1